MAKSRGYVRLACIVTMALSAKTVGRTICQQRNLVLVASFALKAVLHPLVLAHVH
jgi:hypothetical protein